MTDLLIKLFVKNKDDVQNQHVRSNYATLSGITGIIANFLLFVGKLTIGILSASVSIIADAFNNIGDAGSSVVTLVGYRLSGKHADKEHPLGHGRLEYITAFIVDVLIIFVGVELFKTSVEKIIEPGERIAQLVIMPVVHAEFEEALELDATKRGENGFGSTGEM